MSKMLPKHLAPPALAANPVEVFVFFNGSKKAKSPCRRISLGVWSLLHMKLKIQRPGHGNNSMLWFWISLKYLDSRPLLFPVSLSSLRFPLFSLQQPNWFFHMQMWQGNARNITGRTRAKKPVEEWMENRQMPAVLNRFATSSCLRFALQTVRFPTGSARFGSWIWTVPVRFLCFRFVSRFAVRFQNHTAYTYMVQYLHFRILTFPLIWKPRLFMTFRRRISPNGSLPRMWRSVAPPKVTRALNLDHDPGNECGMTQKVAI